jgi:outer membrane lipoprotein-sorting protein
MRSTKESFAAEVARNSQRVHLAFLCGLCACFVLPAAAFLAQNSTRDDGSKYLRNVMGKYSRIKDYTVDIKVHPDLESLRAQDMEARVYYKDPDKVKIDSKGIFILPKDVGIFKPHMFNPDNFNITIKDTLRYDGIPAVRLSLSPKRETYKDRDIILTIDKSEWLIRAISTEPVPGSLMDARINYGNFGGFELPTEIDVNLSLPEPDSSQINSSPPRRFGRGVSGTVTIRYSNYKVNSGLSDSLFEKSEGSSGEAEH